MSLKRIVDRLRRECPWDRKQTLSSIRRLFIEEAYELSQALESYNPKKIEEELGDLLYIVLMGIRIAADAGFTDFRKVEERASRKLIRRHPHVFGDTKVEGEGDVLANWEKIKEKEKGKKQGFFEGIPISMPALLRAQLMQERAARVGFDWQPLPQKKTRSSFGGPSHAPSPTSPSHPSQRSTKEHSAYGPLAKIHEEAEELAEHLDSGDRNELEHELGDLLFSVVNLARHIHLRAEQALARSNKKFAKRFEKVRELALKRGLDLEKMGIEELDKLWDEVKELPQENN